MRRLLYHLADVTQLPLPRL